MSIKSTLQEQVKAAMRAQDKPRLSAIRLILAAVKQIEVDERIEVDDARLLIILDKLAKQRRESISQYQAANRNDLVEQEQFELEIIAEFLPQPLSAEEITREITAAIAATGAESIKDMGKVMAILKPKFQGRADMASVSAEVKQQLNG